MVCWAKFKYTKTFPVTWVVNGNLYVAGGRSDPTTYIDTIEWYNPTSDSWKVVGNLPSSAFISDAAVIGNKVYLVVGSTAEATYSNKTLCSRSQPGLQSGGGNESQHGP